ncbi:hypothetical protein P692DRAFT_20877924 [Suillus brevipes Sb2]|nr:hypothetical protein P692DRAFT_20877924 [Suillus brevipes Sb2]
MPFATSKMTKASARTPWHHRTKHHAITHSQADKAALKEKRLLNKTSYANALSGAQDVLMEQAIKLRAEFGTHSAEYYFEAIMQHSRFQSKKKAPNRWNAFLCAEVKKHNNALSDGEPHAKATELEHEIAMVWNGMTDSEKMEATTDAIEELKEHRANKSIAVHNVPISAFHDAHVTLDKIASELSNLAARTGEKSLLIAVHSDTDHLRRPFVYVSDEIVADYFHTLTRTTTGLCASKLVASLV